MEQKQVFQVWLKLASRMSLKPCEVMAWLLCQQKNRPRSAANMNHAHWFDLAVNEVGRAKERNKVIVCARDWRETLNVCWRIIQFLQNKVVKH